jgi:hypothetical protein
MALPGEELDVKIVLLRLGIVLDRDGGRGSHSFKFQLNLSAFYGTGGECRGCLGGVRWCHGVSRIYDASETAQVELES